MKISSKSLILFLGVAIMTGFFPVYAQGSAEPAPASQEVAVMGKVASVDAESNALQIMDEAYKVHTFAIDPESTVIKKGEKEISLADIQLADLVEVELENGKVIIITVVKASEVVLQEEMTVISGKETLVDVESNTLQIMSGKVTLVDVESNSFQIMDEAYKVHIFTIDPESTVIKKGEKEISLADIQLADVIEVELENEKVINVTVVKTSEVVLQKKEVNLQEKMTVVSGKVTLVDMESSALQIMDEAYKVHTFTIIPESTVIKKGEEEITLTQVQVGDVVEIESEDGIVKSITVMINLF